MSASAAFGTLAHEVGVDLAACLAGASNAACAPGARIGTRAAGVTAPGAPTALTATVSGTTVTFTWQAPADAITNYLLEAGSLPGTSNLANIAIPSVDPRLTVSGVPRGVFYVRLRAQGAGGVSAPSNEVVVTIAAAPPCSGPPNAPAGLTSRPSTVTPRAITLAWSAPSGGCAPSSYVVQLGSARGLSDVANMLTQTADTVVPISDIPVGTYYARVLAANGSGLSAASNEVTVVVTNYAAPTLTSVVQNAYYYGTTQTVTLTGTNFVDGATTVAVTGADVTVSEVAVSSATTLTARVTVAFRTATETSYRILTVTTPGGSATLDVAAGPAPLPPPPVASHGTQTLTFAPGPQVFMVPAGVTSVTIDASGAQGGAGLFSGRAGGSGGQTIATIAVTPGEVLAVLVGGAGGDGGIFVAGAAGSNGGAAGGGLGFRGGGGGGGASDVRQGGAALANRVIVAGGGGGGGFNNAPGGAGERVVR